MNAINSKRPEPHEDDKISNAIIPASELERFYREQKEEQKRRQHREKRGKSIQTGIIIGQTAAIVGLVGVLCAVLPLKELIPVIVNQRDDGTTAAVFRWDDLPKPVREDATINVVWQYVQQRESWSAGNAGWAWTVVSALSAPKVREQFQAWYRADNPQSPAQLYKDMTVQANFVRWEPICPVEKACIAEGPPAYRIWFDRIETAADGKSTPPVRYAATVAIKRNVEIPQDRVWQRWTFNAPQIQVIEYAGAQREGVTR